MKSLRFMAILVALLISQAVWAQAIPPIDDSEDVPDVQAEKKADPEKDATASDDPGAVAPTIMGLSGLFRTLSTDIGSQHSFRVSLHTQMFNSSAFLVCTRNALDGSCIEGDDNSRFAGTLAISYTPWRYLELFANFRSQANSNTRDDPQRLDQEVILALGDFSFGGKFQYPVARAIGVGGYLGLDFLNSVGGVSVNGDAIGLRIGGLTTFNIGALSSVPLRLHLNFGFRMDNSNDLADFSNYPLASLQVEKFALGINPSRLQIKFGMDLALRKWVGWGLTPILEFAFDVATADSDPDFERFRNAGLTDDQISGSSTIAMTVGVRANPVRGFIVELGSDIGLQSPGYGFGPPVIPWNIILGFSYAYDPKPRIKVVTKEKIKTVVQAAPPKPKKGKVRGRVINAKTLEPIAGAVMTFPGRDLTGLSSDPDGGFLSYGFNVGTLPVMVRHPDYLPGKAKATIKVGVVTKLEVKLQPAPPKVGKVLGKVVDLKGRAVVATIGISGPETKQLTAGGDGTFNAELKPGTYTMHVSAGGYLDKEQKVALSAGASVDVSFTISKRPRRPLVRITRRALVIRRKVHFATGTATLKADSRQLLDSVVDVLLKNLRIKQLEIGGHTDNRGRRMMNMQLSQARASAVRQYLVDNGVEPSRLTARGYGPSRPKVPNITRRNRARNRRVEFKILAQ